MDGSLPSKGTFLAFVVLRQRPSYGAIAKLKNPAEMEAREAQEQLIAAARKILDDPDATGRRKSPCSYGIWRPGSASQLRAKLTYSASG